MASVRNVSSCVQFRPSVPKAMIRSDVKVNLKRQRAMSARNMVWKTRSAAGCVRWEYPVNRTFPRPTRDDIKPLFKVAASSHFLVKRAKPLTRTQFHRSPIESACRAVWMKAGLVRSTERHGHWPFIHRTSTTDNDSGHSPYRSGCTVRAESNREYHGGIANKLAHQHVCPP